jgi:hypothetical protein
VGDSGVQESSRRGLSAFLADHEDCGKGFDIQRRDGSDGSIVQVVCGGCGKGFEYPAAAGLDLPAEQPSFGNAAKGILNRDRRSLPDRSPVLDHESEASPARGRPVRLRGWISMVLIAALVGGGVLLIVLGITENSGTSDSTPGAPDTPGASLSSVPLTTPSVPIKKKPPGIKLDRRRYADRVSIGIPAGWNAGVEGLAVTIAPLNGRAQVQVYFEDGARPDDQLTQEARAFLLQRHAGARVAAIGPTDLRGREVRRVRVVYSAGTESATVLVAGGFSYLILEQLSKPFSPELKRTTDAVVASFRPI